jgi:hypothetical protein
MGLKPGSGAIIPKRMLTPESLPELRAVLTKHFGMIDRGKLPAIIIVIRRLH